jgi:hypothetical protein
MRTMFIKNEILASLVEGVLRSVGIANAEDITQKIMDELTTWQRTVAREGSKQGGRKEKQINMKVVQKQLSAGIDLTTIAASQKVSVSTLHTRLISSGSNNLNAPF